MIDSEFGEKLFKITPLMTLLSSTNEKLEKYILKAIKFCKGLLKCNKQNIPYEANNLNI